MKNLLLSLLCIAFLAACSSNGNSSSVLGSGSSKGYPKEFAKMNLPSYSNIISIDKSESKPLGEDGDIQMTIQMKTLDDVNKIGNFYDNSFQKLGYQKSPKDKLKELQEKGAPYTANNFYYGYFQKEGRVCTVTAVTKTDTTGISITFMGS